ncbi:MAG: MFS transporter [Deltaproteobacteria bacterium]|nr:MFS transporter [Deltaproteobacteria bacterium]
MIREEQDTRVFYGVYITLLMFYVLFFTGGGGFYSFQVFIPRLEEEFGWTRFQTVLPGALWAVAFGGSGFFVGSWIQRFGVRRVLAVGLLGGASHAVLMSMITDLWHLFVLSMVAGVILAATTMVPAQTAITLWFNKKRGRAMGLVMMGTGIGGLVAPPLTAWLIQQVGWRGTNRITALVILVLVLPPVLLFLKDKPADIGEVPDGRKTAAIGEATHVPIGIPADRAVRKTAFWLLFFINFLHVFVTSSIMVNSVAFAEGVGYPRLVAPLFPAIAVGFSVPFRFLCGFLADRIGPRILILSGGAFLGGSALALHGLVITLGLRDQTPIWVFGILYGFGSATSFVALPILVGRCFGDLEFGKILGLLMIGFAGGAGFGGPSAARIFDATGSYAWSFILAAIAAALSVALTLLVRPQALYREFVTARERPSPTNKG